MMISEKKSLMKRVLVIIAVIILVSAACLLTTKLVYDGIFHRYDVVAQIPEQLAPVVAGRQVQTYLSGENRLTGYLYRCPEATGRDALVILAPGFHAGADDYLWQISSLLDRGWSVFAYDGTGSCRSEGESTVGFPQSVLDLEATLKYVENCQRFGYNSIVVLGHSQGGYAACCSLDRFPQISAVVTVSGVNSAMEGVMGPAAEYVGPLAYGNYGFLWLYQAMLFGTRTVDLEAAEEISDSDVPVLVIHGADDEQIPADRLSILSHRDEIDPEGVTYILWDKPGESGHTDLLFSPEGTANEELMEQIHGFLSECVN